MEEIQQSINETPPIDLSVLLITLLKGVIYREDSKGQLWEVLLHLQSQVRDYVSLLSLCLVLDESEGYAFLRSQPDPSEGDDRQPLPRLIARRPLSFPISLLLALLRKKLAEFDAGGGDTRLVLSREEIVELIRVFLPENTNEIKFIDQVESHINKITDMGFLRRLKVQSGPPSFEVQRILKAFVDAQWLAEFDAQLAEYHAHLQGETLHKTQERIATYE